MDPPILTKERLLDAIEDMSDFLDGICRLRLHPSRAQVPQVTQVAVSPIPEPESVKVELNPEAVSTSCKDEDSACSDIPEEEPIELASLSSSPAVKIGNPFQLVTAVLNQPIGRAPLACHEAELCDTETQTERIKMTEKSVQTSCVNISAVVDPVSSARPKGEDLEANQILGQPSLVQLWKGLLFASLSALFFSICSVIVKNLKYMHVTQLATVRFTGILLLSFPVAITRDEPLFGTSGTRWMMVVRALSGATSLMLRFFAFQHMPLGDASTIIFSVPIFVTVMARIFLKEACSVFHTVTCFLTLVGIGLISKVPMLFGGQDNTKLVVGENNERLFGIIAALSSCIFAASVIILLRKLKETDPYVIMFNFGWIAWMVSGTATFLFQGQVVLPKSLTDAGLLLTLAVLSFFGQLTLTFSLRTEQAGPVSVMRSTVDIVLVFIWQVLFFHEIPDLLTIAGVILVMACVIFTGFRKWALSLPEQSNTRRKLKWCL